MSDTDKLHHLKVAGLILNDKGEFLLIREIDPNTGNAGKYTFPIGEVEKIPGTTWEILEKNLSRNIYRDTGIEITDGPIPFTDEAFLGRDGFEEIIQFYIGKYKYGSPQISDPKKISEIIWKRFDTFDTNDFEPMVYQAFEKAIKFIAKLTT